MPVHTKLPKYGTPEWEAEIKLFKSLDGVGRAKRGLELGYGDPASYYRIMHARGIRLTVPKSKAPQYNKPPVIKQSSLVIFDSQIPYHDAKFMDNLLDLSISWGIKQGISGGDFLNMAAFSNFFENPEVAIWKREREVAIKIIEAMSFAIENWLLIMGNHEAFLLKRLAEQIGHEDILRLLDKPQGFKATDYYYCKVELGGSIWRISHPRNISVIHGRIPQRLCEKFHCNVASGHGHLAGMTPDFSNKYMACDVGVTCDPVRLDYVSLRDSIRPIQCQGALILMLGDDGKCHPYQIYPSSDWQALKRLYSGKEI